jgi:hypothetical protein
MNRIVLAASLSLFPAALSAQTCMGGASFADRRAQVGADLSFSTGARSVNAGLGLGSLSGPFLSLGFGRAYDDDLNEAASVYSGTAGFGLQLPPRQTTQLCPFISGLALTGVDLADGTRLSAQVFGLGASVGTALRVTPALEVVPFAGVALLTQVTRIYYPSLDDVAGQTDHRYPVSLGAGLVFGKVITIRPSTTFTVAEGRTTTSYGLRFSASFGSVPRRVPLRPGEGSLATVWVNTRVGVYYCQRSRLYGATPQGAFMTEREALASGATPEYGRRC